MRLTAPLQLLNRLLFPLATLALGLTALLAAADPSAPSPAVEPPPTAAVQDKKDQDEEEENGGNIVFHVTSRLQKLSVLFRHETHLAAEIECTECHEDIFKKEFGANRFRMKDINKGKACGVCHQVEPPENVHGAFAPKNNCEKCHILRVREPTSKTKR